jgi:hypothetical protein
MKHCQGTASDRLVRINSMIDKGWWGTGSWVAHARYGLHCGIRPCCVRFYIQTWLNPKWDSTERLAYLESEWLYVDRWMRVHPTFGGSVYCPECIRLDREPVHVPGIHEHAKTCSSARCDAQRYRPKSKKPLFPGP